MARMTTHVLDTARGRPGAGIDVRLYAVGGERELLASAVTNADGRTDKPLSGAEPLPAGKYEIEFDIGRYFAAHAMEAGDPPFLDEVLIRFQVAAGEHYHVPLLVSPWSYSTYRGS